MTHGLEYLKHSLGATNGDFLKAGFLVTILVAKHTSIYNNVFACVTLTEAHFSRNIQLGPATPSLQFFVQRIFCIHFYLCWLIHEHEFSRRGFRFRPPNRFGAEL